MGGGGGVYDKVNAVFFLLCFSEVSIFCCKRSMKMSDVWYCLLILVLVFRQIQLPFVYLSGIRGKVVCVRGTRFFSVLEEGLCVLGWCERCLWRELRPFGCVKSVSIAICVILVRLYFEALNCGSHCMTRPLTLIQWLSIKLRLGMIQWFRLCTRSHKMQFGCLSGIL